MKVKIISALAISLISLNVSGADLTFRRIGVGQGLSGNAIESICKDKEGNMWFSSSCGLYRYNGAEIKAFRHEISDSTSLPEDRVSSILCDSSGRLWVCNGRHLSVYDPKFEKFSTIREIQQPYYLDDGLFGKIFVASRRTCWQINPETMEVSRMKILDPENVITTLKICSRQLLIAVNNGEIYSWDGKGLSLFLNVEGRVKSILETSPGHYWLGTEGSGLYFYNSLTAQVRHYVRKEGELLSDYVRCLCPDDEGNLWIGTINGLNVLDMQTGKFSAAMRDPSDWRSLSHNSVKCIFRDERGGMWLGTYFGGVNYWNRKLSGFKTLSENSTQSSLNDNVVSCIFEDGDGILWLGTNKGGLNSWNPRTGKVAHYRPSEIQSSAGEESNDVKAVFSPDNRHIYIGMHEGGMCVLDKESGRMRRVPGSPASVYFIGQSSPGVLYVGTLKGLYTYDMQTGAFSNTGVLLSGVYFVKKDGAGSLWVLSGSKVNVYQKDEQNGFSEVSIPEIEGIISPTDVLESKGGTMWIASSNGLYRFDRKNGELKRYDETSGFPDKTVLGIEEDKDGSLWASTINGLCRFNPNTESLRVYTSSSGLIGGTFLAYSHTKCSDGRMAFGGVGGLNLFDPASMKADSFSPSPVIYDLEVMGKSVRPGEDSEILEKSISFTDKIDLPAGKNTIRLKFSTPNYCSQGGDVFEYRLVGLDDNWYRVRNVGSAMYAGLPSGDYRFEVRSCNSDGVWCSETTTLRIKVRPVWYESTVFILLIIVLVISGIIFGLRLSIRQRAIQAKLKIEEMKRRHEKELNDLKLSVLLNSGDGEEGVNMEERDRKFLLKAMEIVEKNMSNPDFSIDDFSEAMNMSRSNLHIRMKAVTGQSALEFIHKIRFTEACRLLREGNLTAAEVGYKIGAKTPSYFATSFKRYMGCSPLEYANKEKF